MKKLFIAEKPSVAQQFAEALGIDARAARRDGFLETEQYVVTWCVGHLISMSYPEKYDPALRRWRWESLPFLPETYLYEVVPEVKKQFQIVSGLLNRKDVDCIYVCTDSGREGEYIYRLVEMMAGVKDKERRRVWIDSQTKEEILRGIREAKPESAYDNLSQAAFSRAREDYLMGINFSRALTLRYGGMLKTRLKREKNVVVAVGRVMTCVLGMIVRREQEIRAFQKTVFYKVNGSFGLTAGEAEASVPIKGALVTGAASTPGEQLISGEAAVSREPFITGEFRSSENSRRYSPTDLYKNMGFLRREKAVEFTQGFQPLPREAEISELQKKKETKNPPALYNLAELQNDCSRLFKINPDETLSIAQELYEKKLTTYPRTDARVLSTAVAKEIHRNLQGLTGFPGLGEAAGEILKKESCRGIGKSRYTDDKKITDHYAIIPTGQGLREYQSLKPLSRKVYELILRRFLSIFYPPAVYRRLQLTILCQGETFTVSSRALEQEGYLKVALPPRKSSRDPEGKAAASAAARTQDRPEDSGEEDPEEETDTAPDTAQLLLSLKKGQKLWLRDLELKEGETTPPKRYTSGTVILAMENAGNLIEDEELREQIRGAGIGTSATRAGILTKLQKIGYIALNKKTQVLTPTELGELVTRVVWESIRSLLSPRLTASWEKGLSQVAEGEITEAEYMEKLHAFVRKNTNAIKP